MSDAATAVDAQDRKIISQQDFVASHNVKTVFGLGGFYGNSGGTIIVGIFFTKESLGADVIDEFQPLMEKFKASTAGLVQSGRMFG